MHINKAFSLKTITRLIYSLNPKVNTLPGIIWNVPPDLYFSVPPPFIHKDYMVVVKT